MIHVAGVVAVAVAVVDDHAIVRAGLTTVLGREADVTVAGAFAYGDTFFKDLPRIERLDGVLPACDRPRKVRTHTGS